MSKVRLKILTTLAQVEPAVSIDPLGTVTTPAQTVAPPPSFVASSAPGWTWIPTAYNSQSVLTLNHLVDLVNQAMHYASNGQYNFPILKNINFQIGDDAFSSTDTRFLVELAAMIYKTFINSGNRPAQKISPAQITAFCDKMEQSQALLYLYDLNPTGIVAQKIPGNFGEIVTNVLNSFQMHNPVQQ